MRMRPDLVKGIAARRLGPPGIAPARSCAVNNALPGTRHNITQTRNLINACAGDDPQMAGPWNVVAEMTDRE
jgi:hypothetical protein